MWASPAPISTGVIMADDKEQKKDAEKQYDVWDVQQFYYRKKQKKRREENEE